MPKQLKFMLSNLIPEEYRWKIKLFEQWDSIIGPLKNNVVLLRVKNDQLLLGVSHPTWVQELLFLSPILKDKINSLFQKEHIKDIRFKIINVAAHRKAASFSPNNANRLKTDPAPEYTLNSKEKAMLNCIKDKELRAMVEGFFIRCTIHRRGRNEKGKKKKGSG